MPARPETSAQRRRNLRGERPGATREAVLRRASDPRQAEADHLRKTQRWVRLRAWFLRQHPLCVACRADGRAEPAVDVDHVVPVRTLLAQGAHEAVFDPANLQALCRPCHAAKSARERHGVRAANDAATPVPHRAHPPGGEGPVSTAEGPESARLSSREFSTVSGARGAAAYPGGLG
ncbi:MAG: HNH endonuclease [Planctomycetes bacterium]|nr:HNH endonuclease [Planctomycetota bacterium]